MAWKELVSIQFKITMRKQTAEAWAFKQIYEFGVSGELQGLAMISPSLWLTCLFTKALHFLGNYLLHRLFQPYPQCAFLKEAFEVRIFSFL